MLHFKMDFKSTSTPHSIPEELGESFPFWKTRNEQDLEGIIAQIPASPSTSELRGQFWEGLWISLLDYNSAGRIPASNPVCSELAFGIIQFAWRQRVVNATTHGFYSIFFHGSQGFVLPSACGRFGNDPCAWKCVLGVQTKPVMQIIPGLVQGLDLFQG